MCSDMLGCLYLVTPLSSLTQADGCSFSLSDKNEICRKYDVLSIGIGLLRQSSLQLLLEVTALIAP
jgi:hypothetical protein